MKINLTIKPISEWIPKLKQPLLIAGPCSAESESQMIATASQIRKQTTCSVFRAGVWKPRTRPNSFEGVGEIGLEWLKKVKAETGLFTAVEVANKRHVELALEYGVDILWIGARTTVNPFLVQEIADALKGSDAIVLVKNPVHPDIQLWIGALERINNAGITKLGAIHRGFHSSNTAPFRNTPLWNLPMELKTICKELPIICDPSHICGNTELIPYISQKAMDLAMDGLMIETHIQPNVALSDAKQQITPLQLAKMLDLIVVRNESVKNIELQYGLELLREKIDQADEELLQIFARRADFSKKIGAYKSTNGITVFQVDRWKELLKNRMQMADIIGLETNFVKNIFTLIHEESVRQQTELINQAKRISA